jgi:hypothetical protein
VITDALEIQMLSQLQQKRAAEARVQAQQEWGLRKMADSINGVTMTPAPTPTAPTNRIAEPLSIKAPDGIMNRSPITNNHYHTYSAAPPAATVVVEPQPAPAPIPAPVSAPQPTSKLSPWWLVVPALIAIAGATYLLWPKPKPAPVATAPASPTLNSTIRWSQVP